MSRGSILISNERLRQQEVKGYNEGDEEYTRGELVAAAVSYIYLSCPEPIGVEFAVNTWPWPDSPIKRDGGTIRELTKAGALIAAEIDRLLAVEVQEASDGAADNLHQMESSNEYPTEE